MTRRRWWILSLLTVVPIVGLLVWLKRPDVLRFPVQQVVLTNGTTLQLVSVQLARVHTDPFSPRWQQWAALLPESWHRGLRVQSLPGLNATDSDPVLTVWLTSSKAPANANQRMYGVIVGDDEGNFYDSVSRGLAVTAGKPDQVPHYEAHRFSAFPRRSRELRIRVFDRPSGDGRFLHEFRIPNPAPLPPDAPPAFVGQPLPLTVATNDLEATLTSLSVFPPAEDPDFPELTSSKARLEFTLRQGGVPTTNWLAYGVSKLSDGSGNEGSSRDWRRGWRNGRSHITFARLPLPAGEPWRMQVEFRREHGFQPHELGEFLNIPIQPQGGTSAPRTNIVSGTELRVTEVSATSNRPFERGGKRTVELRVEAGNPTNNRPGQIAIARAIDSTGLTVASSRGTGFDNNLKFILKVSTNATSLDVWIAYAPSLVLEFTAQPTLQPRPDRSER